MKRLFVILAFAILAGTGSYFLAYSIVDRTFCHTTDLQAPLGWMRQDYHLDDKQFAQIKKLEDDYAPHCSYMCDRIDQSRMSLKTLIMTQGSMSPEVKAALQKYGEVQQQCREDLLDHAYEISKVMPPAEGKRYLEMMQAQVVQPEASSNTAIAQH